MGPPLWTIVPTKKNLDVDVDAVHRLKTIVDKYCHDSSVLFTHLKQSGAVIAGSAVAQALLGVSWANSDLDIWLPSDARFSWPDDGSLSPEKLRMQDLPSGNRRLIELFGTHEPEIRYGYPGGDYMRFKRFVTAIVMPKQKVQIILVQSKGVRPSFLLDAIATFDIEALQIAFDGKRFWQIQLPGAKLPVDLLHQKVASLSVRAAEMQRSLPEWFRTCERLMKYAKRGLKVQFSLPAVSEFARVLQHALIRCEDSQVGAFVERWNRAQGSLAKLDGRFEPIKLYIPEEIFRKTLCFSDQEMLVEILQINYQDASWSIWGKRKRRPIPFWKRLFG